MQTTPLHPLFGVEITGVDLRDVTESNHFPDMRALFEAQSLLLLRGQVLDEDTHLRIGAYFGKVEDRTLGKKADKPPVAKMTNVAKEGGFVPENDFRLMHLQANQLWHTDSTFLPVPALVNILAAHVVPSRGGETEIATTRAPLADMPDDLCHAAENAVLRHRYAHSRAKISPELAKQEMFTAWKDQAWKAIWRNPVTGADALYIASHAYAVDGMEENDGLALIDRLMAFVTQPQYVYTHAWRPGDVLIWDERATVHRGRPWPYDEERTMTSICVSVREEDGLAGVRAGS